MAVKPNEIVQQFQQRFVWLTALTAGIIRGMSINGSSAVEGAADLADKAVKAFDDRYGTIQIDD